MTIRRFEGHLPRLADGAWVDETAVVIGRVSLGADASVWPNSVVRGDIQRIEIGARTSIQDGTVIHVTHDSRFNPGGMPTHIADDVTVGHRVMLHGCTVQAFALIGMGAVILDGAVVGQHCMVGAATVVPPGKVLESGYLYVGTPATRRRPLTDSELELLSYLPQHYVDLKNRHNTSG
jgi:carbonic anhydrase/acetyltransferase-like protein (isoleucine patch superfamily)